MDGLTIDQVKVNTDAYVKAVGKLPADTDKLYVEYEIDGGVCGFSRYVPFSQVLAWAKEMAVKRGADTIYMLAPAN